MDVIFDSALSSVIDSRPAGRLIQTGRILYASISVQRRIDVAT
jgi:hypothetical protein